MRAILPLLMLGLVVTACEDNRAPVEQPTPMPGVSPFEYPVALWDQRVEGETMLMVHVTELGQVDSAYVLESSGYEEFDSAAVAGARKQRFAPARQGDRRIPMWTRVPVRFVLDTAADERAQSMPGSSER